MKIYYFSDNSFFDMKNRFEQSFKDNFEKKYYFIENVNLDRTRPGSGVDIWKYKTEMIINAIKENMNDTVIISDIDIIFYRPSLETIKETMLGYEIAFQKEHKLNGINIGFISILCNNNTLKFWTDVYNILVSSNNFWDQEIVNTLIYKYKYNINWTLFPKTIWSWSQGIGPPGAKPHECDNLEENIILHHANCVQTKDDKFKQMDQVRNFLSHM